MKSRILLWLEVFIHFLYILFISPFRFRYDSSKNTYTIITSLPHKILPIIIHTIGILSTFLGIYSYTIQIPYSNPRCMFHGVVSYSRYIIYYALLHTFWTKREDFTELFIMQQKQITMDKSTTKVAVKKFIAWLMCLAMIAMAIVIDGLQFSRSQENSFQFAHYVTYTFKRRGGGRDFEDLFAQSSPGPGQLPVSNMSMITSSNPPGGSPFASVDFWFAMIYTVITFYVRICNHVALLFSVLAAVTVHQASNLFIDSVESDPDQDRVIDKYMSFCKFGCCLNKVCGLVILASIICAPPFYIVYLIGQFTTFETTGPRIIFYGFMYMFLFIISCEAASKAGEFKEWIIEYGRDDHETELFAIFVDISQNPLGLRGVGCFTITYGFVAKMFSVIISFTIILLQFETTPTSEMTSTPCF